MRQVLCWIWRSLFSRLKTPLGRRSQNPCCSLCVLVSVTVWKRPWVKMFRKGENKIKSKPRIAKKLLLCPEPRKPEKLSAKGENFHFPQTLLLNLKESHFAFERGHVDIYNDHNFRIQCVCGGGQVYWRFVPHLIFMVAQVRALPWRDV